jgi:hypothetical protein
MYNFTAFGWRNYPEIVIIRKKYIVLWPFGRETIQKS